MLKEESDMIGPLVCIKDDPQNGLKIEWNFHGLMSEKKYETFHTFIFVNMEVRICQSLLKIYYEKLNLGEIMGIFKIKECSRDPKSAKASIKWTQKTTFSTEGGFINSSHICSTSSDAIQLLLPCISKQNGLIIINIVCNQANSLNNYKKTIKNIRHSNPESDKIVFNIISEHRQKHESLNREQGIHFIQLLEDSLDQTTVKIHKNIRSIVLKKIRFRIYLNSHKIFKLLQNTSWKLSQAPYLQKVFYGIHSCNFNEYLIFLLKQHEAQKKIDLRIILDISFYDGREVRAAKHHYCKGYQKSYGPTNINQLDQQQLDLEKKLKKIKSYLNQTLVLLFQTYC